MNPVGIRWETQPRLPENCRKGKREERKEEKEGRWKEVRKKGKERNGKRERRKREKRQRKKKEREERKFYWEEIIQTGKKFEKGALLSNQPLLHP